MLVFLRMAHDLCRGRRGRGCAVASRIIDFINQIQGCTWLHIGVWRMSTRTTRLYSRHLNCAGQTDRVSSIDAWHDWVHPGKWMSERDSCWQQFRQLSENFNCGNRSLSITSSRMSNHKIYGGRRNNGKKLICSLWKHRERDKRKSQIQTETV